MTPLVEWTLLRRKPLRMEWLAVALSLLGALLVSGGMRLPTTGDALILLAALLRGVNVCVTQRLMRDPVLTPLSLTAIQAGTVGFGSMIAALMFAPEQWRTLPEVAPEIWTVG
jgi:drug/metabolite transporter (DMT)-like permease